MLSSHAVPRKVQVELPMQSSGCGEGTCYYVACVESDFIASACVTAMLQQFCCYNCTKWPLTCCSCNCIFYSYSNKIDNYFFYNYAIFSYNNYNFSEYKAIKSEINNHDCCFAYVVNLSWYLKTKEDNSN